MKYCKRCVMPDTRPGIKFNDEGICYPCLTYERRLQVDWQARWQQLEQLADRYRGSNGNYYDCIVTASAGKDSYYQVWTMKERLGMNPLLVSIDNFSWTDTGRQNQANMSDAFGCDMHLLSLSRKVARKMFRKGFEDQLIPCWYWDRAVYTYPLQIAIRLGIPLIVYGENVNYEYGGEQIDETYSALDQVNNNVVRPIPWDAWLDDEISMKDMNPLIQPSQEEITAAGLDPIYLSYFEAWDGYRNFEVAKKFGFKSLEEEWVREGLSENYEQIDTIGYNVHPWFKFIKFGHQHNTDILSQWVRSGRITRSEAVEIIKTKEHILDRRMLADFLSFLQISEAHFWSVVDRFANRNILEKRDGVWRLQPQLEHALETGGEVC
jgi:N-acetyl sugar amidotransferase